MDHSQPPLAVSPAAAAPRPAPHQIHLCRTCRHTGQPCGPGLAMLARLRGAIAATGLGGDFEISGSASLTGCSRPCTVAWRASADAAWLFGDVDPATDVGELVALAALCEAREAGGGEVSPAEAPVPYPAAMIVTRAGIFQ